jgi:hypothetical protein
MLAPQEGLRSMQLITWLTGLRGRSQKIGNNKQIRKVSNIIPPSSSGLGSYLRLFGCEFEGTTIFETSAASCLKAQPPTPEECNRFISN